MMNVDNISRRIFQMLNLGSLGVLLSVLLYEKLAFPHRELVANTVLILLAFIFAFLLLLWVVRWASFLIRAHAHTLLGRSYEYTCQFVGETGTLSDTVRYRILNFSFAPHRTIFNDSEGFAVPTRFCPCYTLESRSSLPDGEVKVIGASNPLPLTQYKDYASDMVIYQGMWGLTLDPPLQPFETITFVRHSLDENVDIRAFKRGGTDFIFRCRTPFMRLSVAIHAPVGYRFADVTPKVDTESGKHVPLSLPFSQFSVLNKSTIAWRVPYPHVSYRYKIHFCLVPIAEQERREM